MIISEKDVVKSDEYSDRGSFVSEVQEFLQFIFSNSHCISVLVLQLTNAKISYPVW